MTAFERVDVSEFKVEAERPLVWNTPRLSVRLDFVPGTTVEPKALIPVFHQLIKERLLEDVPLIDAINYAHVQKGAGVMLIARDGFYGVDHGSAGPGLSYARKRGGPLDPEQRLVDAIGRAQRFAALLRAKAGLEVEAGQLRIGIDDRLVAPSTIQTYASAQPLIRRVLRSLYGEEPELEWAQAPGRPFAVTARVWGSPVT